MFRESLIIIVCILVVIITAPPIARAGDEPEVEKWLNANPKIRDSVKWLGEGNTAVSYKAWTASQKADLQAAFAKAWNDQPSGLPDVPTNLFKGTGSASAITVLSPSDAWKTYISLIAASLSAEVGNRVPWSVLSYSSESLAILFDAKMTFEWDSSRKGYRVLTGTGNGWFTPSPPDKAIGFLKQNSIINLRKPTPPQIPAAIDPSKIPQMTARPPLTPNPNITAPAIKIAEPPPTRQMVIANLIEWMRRNTQHFPGGSDAANMLKIFKYNGYPTLSSILAAKNPATERFYIAGCWGVSGFISGVLRPVNIPVTTKNCCGHSCTSFPADSLFLSHGDDVYGTFSNLTPWQTPEFPSAELLVSAGQYNKWLGVVSQETFSDSSQCDNVGRQPLELSIKYLTTPLLQTYCESGAKRSTTGPFFKTFSKIYTIEQLDAMGIWAKMDAKIAAKGGCSKL